MSTPLLMNAQALLLLLILATCSAEAVIVASWRQDEISGNLIDETRVNPEATPVGTPTYANPGVPNGTYGSIVVGSAQGTSIGYGPSATDAYFVAGDDNNNPVMNIDSAGQLTAMGWMRPETPTQTTSFTYRMIGTGSNAGADGGWGLGVRFTITGGVRTPFVRFTAYGVIDKDSTPITVSFGEWIHIAATYDNGITSLYLNGDFLSTHADFRLFTNDSTNNRQVIGGRLGGSNNEQTGGLLDGVRVYDSILSVEEIRAAAIDTMATARKPQVAALFFMESFFSVTFDALYLDFRIVIVHSRAIPGRPLAPEALEIVR